PRRFGKSLLINTLECLFSQGLDYFHGLYIEKKWNDTTYKVIYIDFSRMIDNDIKNINYTLSKKVIQQFSINDNTFNDQDYQHPDIILDEAMQTIPRSSLVLLIDEYDAPLTHHIDKPNLLQDILNTLNKFYATVKQYTDKFRLIFITGVTRVSHVSIFSAFNNLKDLSLDSDFNSLLGFTQSDLKQYFDPYIENASQILCLKKEDVYQRLEQYYDGFKFSLASKETLYNPWSILNFLASPKNGFKNYWFDSSGISSLMLQYLKISNSFDILNYKKREIYKTENQLLYRYDITNIPHDILLYQSGYLTLRNQSDDIARLVFPNTEVQDSILDLYLTANNLQPNINFAIEIQNLEENINQRNLLDIVNTFNAILNDSVSILSNIFDDERSIRDVLYAALPQKITLQKIKERETLKGRSDLELITPKTHMVIEFKHTKIDRDAASSLQEAMHQLQSRNYGQGAFQDHFFYRVAMVISTENKEILLDFCKELL
ncbi:MAG: AAA family ATPase, partial [Desulfovibrionaceae bacterium]|nr:AAA family ATPase [Desulfovibrionaceae bacterium]